MSIEKKYLTEALVNQVLQARERKNQKGMVLTHDKTTDKLVKFKIRY